MRFFVIIFALLIFPLCASAQEDRTVVPKIDELSETPNTVRGFVWGVTVDDIKEYEKGKFLGEDGELIYYEGEMFSETVALTYEIIDEELNAMQAVIRKFFSRPQDRIDMMLSIKEQISEEYGEPIEENFIWSDNREKYYPQFWGWAVYRGELSIETIWQDDNTVVTAKLWSPKQYHPQISVTYENRLTHERLEQDEIRVDDDLFIRGSGLN